MPAPVFVRVSVWLALVLFRLMLVALVNWTRPLAAAVTVTAPGSAAGGGPVGDGAAEGRGPRRQAAEGRRRAVPAAETSWKFRLMVKAPLRRIEDAHASLDAPRVIVEVLLPKAPEVPATSETPTTTTPW